MKNIKEGNVTTINPRWNSVWLKNKNKQLCLPTPRLYTNHPPLYPSLFSSSSSFYPSCMESLYPPPISKTVKGGEKC